VSRSNDGTARAWDLENGETTLVSIGTINNVYVFIYSLDTTIFKFATDGNNLENGFLKVWHSMTGKLVADHNDTGTPWIVKSIHFNVFITDRRDFQ
jgi:WD40 repeat protein